jgi:hypothetical protein
MSWLYSRVLVEDSSVDISLDGEQCALWSGTHMPRASWLPAKTTDACLLSRSGMMYKPLTGDLGEGLLMSYLEGFRAKTSQVQEREPALTESEVECGSTWQELSVKYDPSSSSWKTAHCLFQEDLPESSVTLPKWGMMQNGECWERTMSEHLIKGNESGLWPTPQRVDYKGTSRDSVFQQRAEQYNLWGMGQREHSTIYPNPMAYEAIMGWPIQWTELKPLEMDKFQRWLDLHGMS